MDTDLNIARGDYVVGPGKGTPYVVLSVVTECEVDEGRVPTLEPYIMIRTLRNRAVVPGVFPAKWFTPCNLRRLAA